MPKSKEQRIKEVEHPFKKKGGLSIFNSNLNIAINFMDYEILSLENQVKPIFLTAHTHTFTT